MCFHCEVWKRRFVIIGFLIFMAYAISACGTEEQNQLGIDGYVWLPQQIGGTEIGEAPEQMYIWTTMTMPQGFKTSGEWLYYVQLAENGNSVEICRIPKGGMLEFSQSEVVVSLQSLGGYTVDQDQNLYYYVQQYSGSWQDPKPDGITLYSLSPEKEIRYEVPLEGTAVFQYGYTDNLAAGMGKELLFLMDDEILRIDGEGNVKETASIDNYRDAVSWMKQYLLETTEGTVYYVNIGDRRRVWECSGSGSMQFEEITVLRGYSNSPYLFRDTEGILAADSNGTLYQYRKGEDALSELLRWEDSDIYVSDFPEIAMLDEEKMLLMMENTQGKELYLLTRTPTDQLPEREQIVLASLFPTDTLRRAVVEFNRENDRYHVTIENYGADAWYAGVRTENEAAYSRLDAVIVSGNGPDMLDLTYQDIYKYTDKGLLEDLSPYMESCSFQREDLLDNLQEGFTLGGRLVCIPKYFTIHSVAGRVSQAGEKSGWTMDEFMAFADGQAASAAVNGQDSQSMADSFFTDYYLNALIDWQNGICMFDDDRFRAMLEWIQNNVGDGVKWIKGYIPENVLLEDRELVSFSDYMTLTERFGEEIILKGYPSADGKPVHRARAIDGLSILAHSDHKEGAWEFLDYYLSKEDENGRYFSTRKSILQAQAEEAATPFYIRDSEGNLQYREDGSVATRMKLYIYVGDERIAVDCVPQEHVDALLKSIREIDFAPESMQESEIVEIVSEEAAYYFHGTKSLDEVIEIIQNRANMVIQTGH